MTQPESRTVEERLATLLWDTFSTRPHAEHEPGECETCDWYRKLSTESAADILAAAKEHGLVIGEGGLDRAWKEAEAALPDGWAINMLWGTVTEDRWAVSAGPFPADETHTLLHRVAGGPTPAVALHVLAERLRR